MEILPFETSDFEQICMLFEAAIAFQKEKGYNIWNGYDKAVIWSDINNGNGFKLMINGEIALILSLVETDTIIWSGMESAEAFYLHRFISHPNFKGLGLAAFAIEWMKTFAITHKKTHLRLDTWSDNPKIIQFYKNHGFCYLQNQTLPNTPDLPIQARGLVVALMEMELIKYK